MSEQEQREPDQADDPRQQGTGQGYPESNPEGTTPGEGTESGPEAGAGGASDASDRDGDPGQATGNPGAAGSDQ
jgi:hypothetical protein